MGTGVVIGGQAWRMIGWKEGVQVVGKHVGWGEGEGWLIKDDVLGDQQEIHGEI
jgi:hypothetical protein